MSELALGLVILLLAVAVAGWPVARWYGLIGLLLSPVALVYYAILSLRKRTHLLGDLAQRFGFFKFSAPRGSLWLHGASVGEVQLAGRLVDALDPAGELPVVVSAVTAQGVQRAGQLSPRVRALLHPLDLPFAAARAVRRIRPRLLVLIEGDYWLLTLLHARLCGARIAVANARVSARAFPRMRLAGAYYRACFRLIDEFQPRGEADRARLLALGVKPAQLGPTADLKFDLAAPPPSPLPPGGPVFVAGSVYAPEFSAVLAAFAEAKGRTPALRLLFAPRRREEFDAAWRLLSELCAARGWTCERRSAHPGAWPQADAWLLDTFGELAGVYPGAALAFAGGSLFPHGGQSPLEAAAAGVPVLYGPSMENFARAAEQLADTGAGIAVTTETLAATLCGLLENPGKLAAAGDRARALVEANRGALAACAARLREEWDGALLARPAIPAPPVAPLARPLRLLLTPAGWLWRLLLALHDATIGEGTRLNAPAISVGNLSLGGTGKTPVTIALGHELHRRGLRVAVLSRGYGRAAGGAEVAGDPPDPARVGDEPALIAAALPHAKVAVAADRREAVRALGGFTPDVYLLDDGFQHRKVARDLDLVLMDPSAPLSTGEALPFGSLRGPLAALDRADLQLFPNRRPSGLRPFAGGGVVTPAALPTPAAAWCAIANPAQFTSTLEALGLALAWRGHARDHHRPTSSEFAAICETARAARAGCLIVTEKDAVKLRALTNFTPPLPLFVLAIEAEFGPADTRRLAGALDRLLAAR